MRQFKWYFRHFLSKTLSHILSSATFIFQGSKICLFCLLLIFLLSFPSSLIYAQASSSENILEETGYSAEEASELSLFEKIPTIVTASKRTERITEAPSIISVITEEDIERMGARTIIDVLRTIPGIEIVRNEYNTSQIAVRGLLSESSAGIKILFDGHTLNDPITGGATAFYDDLPLRNVQRIEIIRGPASALYGTNAFVSVVNIITKEAQDINGLEVSMGTGSNHTINPSFLYGEALNDVNLTLYFDYYTTKGDKFFINSDSMTGYDSLTGSTVSLAPGSFSEEREKIDLSYKVRYHDFTLHGKFYDKHRGPFLTNAFVLNEDSTEDTRHFYTELEYSRFLTERVEFHSKVYVDYYEYDVFENFARGITLFSDNDKLLTYPNGLSNNIHLESWRFGNEEQLNVRLFKNNDLTLGFAYEYSSVGDVSYLTNIYNVDVGVDPDVLLDIREFVSGVNYSSYQTVAAVFLQDTWRIRDSIDLTFGMRGDFFDDYGGVFTPKAAMVYEPNQDFNIKLLFGSAFRVPSFSETLIENPEEESSTEELHTFEVGFGYKPTEWLVAEVNYFNTEINELTEVTNGEEIGSYPIGTTQTYRTVGGFDAQGVEIELRGTSEKDINLGIIPRIISSTFRLNYSYQDTQDSQTHEKVPNMAKHKGNIGVGFNLSAEKRPDSRFNALSVFRTFSDELSLYFNLFLCGERERSTNDIRGPLPGYGVLDMTLTAHDVFHRGLDLSFSIKNMLDKEYYDPSPELTDIYSLSTIPDDYPNPGRTFYVELHYLF